MVSYFKTQEEKKFGFLAFIFGLIIGTYWLLRPIKDAVFFTMVGKDFQPDAKLASIVIVGLVVYLYSKLVDAFARHKLLYFFSIFYAVGTALFAFLIWHPDWGISNVVANPYRWIGWAWYMFVETYGLLMVSLFWSFVSDTTHSETAKKSYFTLAIGGQSGALISTLLATYLTKHYGTGLTLLFPASLLIILVVCIMIYMKHFFTNTLHHEFKNAEPLEGEPETSFLEGLTLLFKRPYLFGIFLMMAFYEIITTILDYHFKVLASNVYTGNALTHYFYNYALWTNGIAVASLLLGIGAIGRRLGMGKTLVLLPLLVGTAIIVFYKHSVLWVACAIMVSCKALNFALVQPSKEQLYIPTTSESKYKAKAWIDMFGSRSAKGAGSWINKCKRTMDHETFMWLTTIISLGLISIWIVAAILIGRIHAKAIKEKRLVC